MIGETNGNTKLVQFVNGAHRFGVIASETISAFDYHMGEFACTRIR
ncbi:MAG: hypothetical protein RLP44_08705 [Aggregatilineales bacterium]